MCSIPVRPHPCTFTSTVLCGRGGGINKHVGNMIYRRIVEYNKAIYRQVPKRQRMLVSQSIVETILKEGGRFLQDQQQKGAPKNSGGASSVWIEISSRRAVQKTSQALRERSDSFIDDTNGVDMTTPKTASILESLAQGSKRPVKSCVPL